MIVTKIMTEDKMAVYFLIQFLDLGDCIMNDENFRILFTTKVDEIKAKPIILDFHLKPNDNEYSPLLADNDPNVTIFGQFLTFLESSKFKGRQDPQNYYNRMQFNNDQNSFENILKRFFIADDNNQTLEHTIARA